MRLQCTIICILKWEHFGRFFSYWLSQWENIFLAGKQKKCRKFWRTWPLMQPNILKQCLSLHANVLNPHGNRGRCVFSMVQTRRKELIWFLWCSDGAVAGHSRSSNIQGKKTRYVVAQQIPAAMPSLHYYYCTFHYTMSGREVHKHRVLADPLSHTWMGELCRSLPL